MRVCIIEGCGKTHRAHGYCGSHARRLRTHGDPLAGRPSQQALPTACAVGGCGKTPIAKGVCAKHYARLRKYGDASVCAFEHSDERREWRVEQSEGYVVRYAPDSIHAGSNGYEYQHRFVVGELIGRRLLSTETVHHINGVRADNAPKNLELWAKTQPAGQRVEDLVKWAHEILEMYEDVPLLLAGKVATPRRRPALRIVA